MATRTKFYLECDEAKWKGVCAGFAEYSGIDVFWVRLAVIASLVAQQWWVILAYLVVAHVAERKPTHLYQDADDAAFWQGVRTNTKRSATEVRSKFRDLDRRLADMETHFTSRNRQLADEIDNLR